MKKMTKARAMREAKALCKALGPGWVPEPFKMIDWWVPRAKCGEHVSLYPDKGFKRHHRYFANFTITGFFFERGATPRSTTKKLLTRMKKMSSLTASHIEMMQKRA